MVRQTNCEAVTLERDVQIREFKPSAKGKWDALVSSMMQVSVGDQIRVTGGFREGKNVFKNNDIAQVRESPVPSLSCMTAGECAVIDQGTCITSHASQCRTVECCRTALMQKVGMSAYRGLETRCTSTPATR